MGSASGNRFIQAAAAAELWIRPPERPFMQMKPMPARRVCSSSASSFSVLR